MSSRVARRSGRVARYASSSALLAIGGAIRVSPTTSEISPNSTRCASSGTPERGLVRGVWMARASQRHSEPRPGSSATRARSTRGNSPSPRMIRRYEPCSVAACRASSACTRAHSFAPARRRASARNTSARGSSSRRRPARMEATADASRALASSSSPRKSSAAPRHISACSAATAMSVPDPVREPLVEHCDRAGPVVLEGERDLGVEPERRGEEHRRAGRERLDTGLFDGLARSLEIARIDQRASAQERADGARLRRRQLGRARRRSGARRRSARRSPTRPRSSGWSRAAIAGRRARTSLVRPARRAASRSGRGSGRSGRRAPARRSSGRSAGPGSAASPRAIPSRSRRARHTGTRRRRRRRRSAIARAS